ncbi:MAG: hypothetical protein HN842_09615 [Gammaproteobacteria bacterium]|jgi:hypothetical protein|nr:hypothetical protein [Gammaproteobacteria bacterium]
MTVPRPLMKHIVVEERSISSTVDEQPLSEQQTDKEKLELKLKRQKAQQRAEALEAERARVEKEREAAVEQRQREIQQEEASKRERREAEQKRKIEREQQLDHYLKQVSLALDGGESAVAEAHIEAFKLLRGEDSYKNSELQRLVQRLKAISVVFADLEQANEAEQYLLRLMDEAVVLAQQGELEAAKERYHEVLALAPGNQGARDGLATITGGGKRGRSETAMKAAAPLAIEVPSVARKKATLLKHKGEGWVVQVATMTKEKRKKAYELLGSLKKSGFRGAFIKKQELAGRQLYRLRIGVYAEKWEAEEALNQLNQNTQYRGYSGRTMFQK